MPTCFFRPTLGNSRSDASRVRISANRIGRPLMQSHASVFVLECVVVFNGFARLKDSFEGGLHYEMGWVDCRNSCTRWAVCLGSSPSVFVDVPAMLFVVLMGGGILVAAHGVGAIRLVALAAIGSLNEDSRLLATNALQTATTAFIAAGWLGVLIGVVQLLANLDDPAAVGPAAAVALLTAFYGHSLAWLGCLPLARSLVDRKD